jgi:hypothetical protein
MISEHWIMLGVAVAGFFYVSGIVLAVDAQPVWFKFGVGVAGLMAPIQ